MAEVLLEVRDLSRRFAAVDALKDVNFSVVAGEIHALIGPNGAGKTTFIHHVSGALKPDSGSVHFAGSDVTGLAMHDRVAAGMARSLVSAAMPAGACARGATSGAGAGALSGWSQAARVRTTVDSRIRRRVMGIR